ncbi:MAG: ABC transporter substrate-binding protein [Pseudomonadota bacterium]
MRKLLCLCLIALTAACVAWPVSVGAEETLTIGYSGPITFARYGKNCLEGLQMYAEDLNAEGGLKVGDKTYKLEVVALDDKYNPELSAKNAMRLSSKEKAPLVFVPHSGGIFAMMKFNQKSNFIIGAYSSDPHIDRLVEENKNPWIVRIPPNDRVYVFGFANLAMEMGIKNLAMIPGAHQYAKDWADDLQAYWEYKGGKVVAREPANYYGQTDFYPYLSKAIEAKPDGLFLCGPSDVCANIVKQAHQLGYKGKFIMCDQAKLDEMEYTVGVEAIEGSIGVISLDQLSQMSTDLSKNWRDQYRKRYNYVPTWEALLHYMSLDLFCRAMKMAGTVEDKDAIMAAMPKIAPPTPPFVGGHVNDLVNGVIRQCLAADAWVQTVENGKFSKPGWCGPAVLPFGYYEIPGKKAE